MDAEPTADMLAADPRDYRAISYGRDGRVVAVRSFAAESDADALAQMEAWVREFAMDLWNGLRFVEHVAVRSAVTEGGLVPGRRVADG